ncbi:MAG: hypothetical protein IPM47_19490 [Sphingobacteriales bacterium]|nr:MAG: hypothetical protein IPM47_19490 [Sphingobacteriales bacterium]
MLSIPEELLESVEREVRIHQDYLIKIAQMVISQNISEYPIFILHKEPGIQLGRPVIEAESAQSDWNINASLIEELVKKGLISPSKLEEFKKIYKNPLTHLCLFVISGQSDAGFAFCPYSD